MLKLVGMNMGAKQVQLVVDGEPEELTELVKRIVMGDVLAARALPTPAKPASAPASAPPAAAPVSSAPPAATAPTAPQTAAAAAPAPKAPKPPKAAPAPTPAPTPPPSAVLLDDEVEGDEDDAAAASSEIPTEVLAATKLREVLTALQRMGHTTKDALTAWCVANQAAVPVLAKMDSVPDRVARAANLLGIE